MAWDFKNSEDVRLFLENLGIEYKYWCYKENDPKGCHNLADYLETVNKDFKTARAVYEENCTKNNFGRSCFECGKDYLLGRGCTKNNKHAYELFEIGCKAGCKEACTNAGLMNLKHDRRFQLDPESYDYDTALRYLDRGCELGDNIACKNASTLFLSSLNGIAKQMDRAFYYAKRGCDLGNMESCANVYLMYKRGEGTERNEKLAEYYKSKVLNYKEELNFPINLLPHGKIS